uniref:hypothetical protein n=1 Tax=Pseudomonas syringae TaxID=317 RepID=UPI001E657839|nr:hypothetical protein [Pseudomonas syringae]QOQ33337.1 hypothetical protein [Pseudomonas syringae pv. actinidiae]
MSKTFLAALLALSVQQAQAEKPPTFIEVYPGASQILSGDGSTWEVTVSTVYKNKDEEIITKPVYTLKTTSGKCAFGREQILNMHGGFQVKVADQFCAGTEKGHDANEIYLGGWMTAPYPNDVADWAPQDEAHFVYGDRWEVRMDKNAKTFEAQEGVFRYRVRKL